jgi:isopenicillin N synthase-like dioxygenase
MTPETHPKSATLQTISYSKLCQGDPSAIRLLYQAGIENGFFYLDLGGPESTQLLHEAETLFQAAEEVFDLQLEMKMTYDLDVIGPAKINGSANPVGGVWWSDADCREQLQAGRQEHRDICWQAGRV